MIKRVIKILSISIISLCIASEILYGYEVYPQGDGYWMNEATGREIFEQLKTRRLKLTQLQQDYEDLSKQYSNALSEMNSKTTELEGMIRSERIQHQRELLKKSLPGFGIFAGPAYNWSDSGIEFVVGFGIVWKFW